MEGTADWKRNQPQRSRSHPPAEFIPANQFVRCISPFLMHLDRPRLLPNNSRSPSLADYVPAHIPTNGRTAIPRCSAWKAATALWAPSCAGRLPFRNVLPIASSAIRRTSRLMRPGMAVRQVPCAAVFLSVLRDERRLECSITLRCDSEIHRSHFTRGHNCETSRLRALPFGLIEATICNGTFSDWRLARADTVSGPLTAGTHPPEKVAVSVTARIAHPHVGRGRQRKLSVVRGQRGRRRR
jgi:hypothetical protein